MNEFSEMREVYATEKSRRLIEAYGCDGARFMMATPAARPMSKFYRRTLPSRFCIEGPDDPEHGLMVKKRPMRGGKTT